MQSRWFLGPLTLAALLCAGSAQAQLKYRIQDLGTLQGGDESLQGLALNNTGAVVGDSANFDRFRPRIGSFIWENGRMRGLVPEVNWSPYYTAVDVNDAGIAVGNIVDRRERSTLPVLYRDGKVIHLFGEPARGLDGDAKAINNAGVVVGWFNGRAFMHDGTSRTFIPVGHPTQFVQALDINDHGLVVGSAVGGNSFNFLWDGTEITRLPKLPGNQSFTPVSINNSGAVVGTVSIPRPGQDTLSQAYIYADGRYQALGPAGTRADYLMPSAINDRNWVVGSAPDEGSDNRQGFLWRNGREVDLNDLLTEDSAGWDLVSARDVNNRGQIVGWGIFNGLNRAYLATPVPETESWLLMMAGMGVVGWKMRRRGKA